MFSSFFTADYRDGRVIFGGKSYPAGVFATHLLNQFYINDITVIFLPMMKDIRNEETDMTVSYKKLWKLLIDKDMKKKDLEKAAGISNYVISKMNKGENITVDIVGKICSALNCTPNDIMEFSDDSI